MSAREPELLSPPAAGFSPPLRITLDMAGQTFEVAATAPDYIKLRDAVDVPPGDATLHVDLDGDVRSGALHFPEGLRTDRRRQPYVRRDA